MARIPVRLFCGRRRTTAWWPVAILAVQLLAGAALAAGSLPSSVLDRKLDTALRLFVVQPDAAVRVYSEHVGTSPGIQKSAATGRVAVLIRLVEGSDSSVAAAALRKAGAAVHAQLGPIVTAVVPIGALRAVAELDVVFSMELERPMTLRLNFSVPATGATALRTGTPPGWTGATGKGVVVGIIDDGIDFRHRDFRNPDGSTRLLGLWDRNTGAAGQPPAGYDYGGECTPAMINAAIGGDAAACTQASSGGHGTHVAGIAAGNGQATGNGQAQYRFIGMAPEADLLAANFGGGSKGVLDAIAWMKTRAGAKPLAINMSFGSYFGARDGTSNYEVALSAASGAGAILVGAAGNEATAPVRAEGPLTQGGQLVFDVDVPAGKSDVRMEAWYPGGDRYSVIVQGPPGCPASAAIGAGAPAEIVETPCGLVAIFNDGPYSNNDDRQIFVRMRTGNSPLLAGTWRFTFAGTQVTGGSATLSIVTGEDGGDMTVIAVNGQPPPAITTQILTDVSGAKRVIAVAAYVTNYSYTTLDGTPSDATPRSGAVGDLSNFSSRGPRRMCSNPVKCPQVMKPEITAPGTEVMAAQAVDKALVASAAERDGVHSVKSGTSMATPHVTGAVALLLQQRPSLTPEDVKRLLFGNVQKTSFTPAAPAYTGADVPVNPNHDWGYGVLDIAKAVAAIPPEVPAAVLTAFEFLYQPENRYFLTIDPNEAAAIDAGAAGAGWQRTGSTFKAYGTTGTTPAGAVPVCRFYGSVTPGPNSHFFTASAAECQALKDLQATTPNTQKRWNYEGIAFRINEPGAGRSCAAGLIPVMRAYNNGFTRGIDSNHRFNTSQAEIQRMVAQGWGDEGVVFCSPQ